MNRAPVMAPALRLRLLAARGQQLLGWPGSAGLVLLALALGVGLSAGAARRMAEATPPEVVEAVRRDSSLPAEALPQASSHKALPTRVEAQELLAQIQKAAVAAGLGWPAAEYRLSPATEHDAATLEVRCSLKGTYPQLRSLLTGLLAEVPGLTVRELAMTRPASDLPEVDAKLVLAIVLRGDVPTAPAKASP